MISWKIKLVEIDRNSGTIIYTENIEIVIWFFFSRVTFYDHEEKQLILRYNEFNEVRSC